MSTPERQQDADAEKGVGYGAADAPDKKGAQELDQRRQSELSQQHAAQDKSDGTVEPDDSTSNETPRSNAEQAKENERKALESGDELPG
jgi:hypothetical protein